MEQILPKDMSAAFQLPVGDVKRLIAPIKAVLLPESQRTGRKASVLRRTSHLLESTINFLWDGSLGFGCSGDRRRLPQQRQ